MDYNMLIVKNRRKGKTESNLLNVIMQSLKRRREKQKEILELAFDLEKVYSKLNFKHHCYLRIAYDNAVYDKWQERVKKTFLKNCTDVQLDYVHKLLSLFLIDEDILMSCNKMSLMFRKNYIYKKEL